MSDSTSLEKNLHRVVSNVKNVLREVHTLRKNSFWNVYKDKYKSLPDLKTLPASIKKRSDVFQHCTSFCDFTVEEGFECLTLSETQPSPRQQNPSGKTSASSGRSVAALVNALSHESVGAYSRLAGAAFTEQGSHSNGESDREGPGFTSPGGHLIADDLSRLYLNEKSKKYGFSFIQNDQIKDSDSDSAQGGARPKTRDVAVSAWPGLSNKQNTSKSVENQPTTKQGTAKSVESQPSTIPVQQNQSQKKKKGKKNTSGGFKTTEEFAIDSSDFPELGSEEYHAAVDAAKISASPAQPESSYLETRKNETDEMWQRGGGYRGGAMNYYHPYGSPRTPSYHQTHWQGAVEQQPTNFYDSYYGNATQQPSPHAYGGGVHQSPHSHESSVVHNSASSAQSQAVTKEQLNVVAKDAIARLAKAEEYVSPERVEKLVLQHFSVSKISQLGIRSLENIDSVFELMKAHSKVNAYIQAFMRVRSVSTLHELQADLENLCCRKGETFDSLQIGPLQSLPIVYEFFKFPEKTAIAQISTCDVLDMLREWLSANDLWRSRNIDLTQFMDYMKEKRGLDSPYELGVRIRSIIMLIQVIKRAQSENARVGKTIAKSQLEAMNDRLALAYDNLRRSLLSEEVSDSGSTCVMRQQYMQQTATEVLNSVVEKLLLFHSTVTSLGREYQVEILPRNQLWQADKMATFVTLFRQLYRNSPLHSALLRLAVCCSKVELREQLWAIVAAQIQVKPGPKRRHVVYDSDGEECEVENVEYWDEGMEAGEEGGGGSGGGTGSQHPKPSPREVEEKLLQYLERVAASGALSLEFLSRIEEKLCDDFGSPSFSRLGHGSFLDCLVRLPTVKKFLEENGGLALGSGHATTSADCSIYQPSQHHLLDFIRQTAITENTQMVEHALCSHYGVKDVRSLGHGATSQLLAHSARRAQHHGHTAREQSVVYEAALCANHRGLLLGEGSRQSGVLGAQSRERALACLQSCPLLEDLGEWSHWELVFAPQWGPLKEFIQKHGKLTHTRVTENGEELIATTQLVAMETKPGVLIKLTADTSHEHFQKALLAGDPRAVCAHLLSVLAVSKGLQHLPQPLLANHVRSALVTLHAAAHGTGAGDTAGGDAHALCRLVLECLTLLPATVCLAVADKVFLQPLSQEVGATKYKMALLKVAATHAQRSRLQVLGLALGVTQWQQTFTAERTQWPRDCLQRPQTHKEEEEDEVLISSDGESESDVEDEPTNLDFDEIINVSQNTEMKSVDLSDDETLASQREKMEDPQSGIIKDGGKKSSAKPEMKEQGPETQTSEAEISVSTDNATQGHAHKDSVPSGSVLNGCADPRFQLIQEIRRNKFAMDFEMSEEVRAVFEGQSEMMGRSLERLSKDLYSKDTHFVLELIQNADDNDYPGMRSDTMTLTSGAQAPSVLFVVDEDKISVHNNEVGFQDKNIRAVCDVGRSTKGKHKFGYIGQKGIGFKSVFRVTDRPEIHSNGFHICFDVHSGPTGYILPHWIGKLPGAEVVECEVSDSSAVFECQRGQFSDWTTSIVLPLKAGCREAGQLRSLAARFSDVHPSLLLFLHRLRRITVNNKVEGYLLEMERRDLAAGLVEIRHNDGADRWLLVRETLDASAVSVSAKAGVEVESTEIALAFQLAGDQDQPTQVLPEKQPVFAFLPLRSYGFRFVIQGDFDVPSSREDVNRDSVWNQWLISNIPSLFITALEAFKSRCGLGEVEAGCRFLLYLPLEDEILDFFRPVATRILQQIRAQPCLPAAKQKGSTNQQQVTWRKPSQLVTCRDALVREVISGDLLESKLGLYFLHPTAQTLLSGSLLTALGVNDLTPQHLLDLGGATLASEPEPDSPAHTARLHFVGRWLACLYRGLDQLVTSRDDDVVMTSLRQVRCVPLAGGRWVSLEGATVFFPLQEERRGQSKRKQNPVLQLLARELSMIDSQLFSSLDDVALSQVRRLLEQLGVRHVTPDHVIHQYILPTLRQPELLKDKPAEMLFAYLVYIKEERDAQPDVINMADLKAHALVLTNQGPRCPAKQAVHFGTEFGNKVDLQRNLPGYKWCLVDPGYLRSTGGSRDSWYRFLAVLGVLDFICVQQTTTTVSRQELADTPWAGVIEFLPVLESYQVADCICEEFDSLVTRRGQLSRDQHHQQLQRLYQLLELNFDVLMKQYTGARILSAEGGVLREVESTFALCLKRLPWLPASVIVCRKQPGPGSHEADGGYQLVEEKRLHMASSLYVRDPKVTDLLYYHVPYLDCTVDPRTSFSDFLGLRKSIEIDTVRSMLIKWCTQGSLPTPGSQSKASAEPHPEGHPEGQGHSEGQVHSEGQALPGGQAHGQRVLEVPGRSEGQAMEVEDSCGDSREVEFFTSLGHMKAVYRYLHENMARNALQELVDRYPLVFHTTHVPSTSTENVLGTFLHCKQLCWADPSNLFAQYSGLLHNTPCGSGLSGGRFLCKLYAEPDLRELFMRVGRVSPTPSRAQYAQLLLEIPGVAANFSQAHEDVLKLYCVLARKALFAEDGSDLSEDLVKLHVMEVKGQLKDFAVIPTKSQRWVRVTDTPLLADDGQLERMWSGQDGVHLVDLGDKIGFAKRNKDSVQLLTTLLRHLGVQPLSSAVEMSPETVLYHPCAPLQYYVRQVAPYVQALLYTEYPNVYDELVTQRDVASKLAVLQFAQVQKLELVYRLRPLPDHPPQVREDKCRIVNGQVFYVTQEVKHCFYDVNCELAKFFSLGNELCAKEIRYLLVDLLPLLEQHENEALSRFLDDRRIDALPAGETPWEVPPPANWPPRPQHTERHDKMAAAQADESVAETEVTSQTEVKADDSSSTGLRAWPPMPPKGYRSAGPAKQSSWPPPPPPPPPPAHSDYRTLPDDMQRSQEGGAGAPQPPHRSGHRMLPESVQLPPRLQQQQTNTQDIAQDEQNPSRSTPHPGATAHPGSIAHPGTTSHPGAASLHSAVTQHPGASATGLQQQSNTRHDAPQTAEPSVSRHDSADDSAPRHERHLEVEYVERRPWPKGQYTGQGSPADHPGQQNSATHLARKRARLESGDYVIPRKPIFHGDPVWLESGDGDRDAAYEPLATGTELLGDDWRLDSDCGVEEVAMWGERLVYSYLCQLQGQPEADIVEVQWMNQANETGLPYDFALKVKDPQGQEVIDMFIEVKSTKSARKAFFEISAQQFRFAQETQERFHLYRVFNAGDQSRTRLMKLVNVASLLDMKQVRLCMVV